MIFRNNMDEMQGMRYNIFIKMKEGRKRKG